MDAELLTDGHLLQVFGSRQFEAGREYFEDGFVNLRPETASGGRPVINAEVQGNRSRPYQVRVTVNGSTHSKPLVDGRCSCPMNWNCKHVAATLMAWRVVAADPNRPPSELEPWLTRLRTVALRAEEAYPPDLRQRLFYVLDVEPGNVVAVRPLSVRLDKGDRPTGPVKLQAGGGLSSTPPKYLRASDLRVLRLMAGMARYRRSEPEDFELKGAAGAQALLAMVDTGRARWRDLVGETLRRGPPLPARGVWEVGPDDIQRFAFRPEAQTDAVVLPLVPPCYFQASTLTFGPLDTGMPEEVVETLLAAPAIRSGAAQDAAERMAQVLGPLSLKVPQPRVLEALETLETAPIPIVAIEMRPVRRTTVMQLAGGLARGFTETPVPVARLSFDYAGVRFDVRDRAKIARAGVAGRTVRIVRDPAVEALALKRLEQEGLRRLETLEGVYPEVAQQGWMTMAPNAVPADFASFLLATVPVLEHEGWRIETDPGFPLRLAQMSLDDWEFGLEPGETDGSGIDWFDLSLGASIEGRRFDILPMVIEIIRRLPSGGEVDAMRQLIAERGADVQMPAIMEDGTVVAVPLAKVAPIVEGLLSVWGASVLQTEGARVSHYQAGDLAELTAQVGGLAWGGDQRLLALGEALRGWAERTPTPTPVGFQAHLRPYQQTGLDWLQMLARTGFGGVLADDMGLGKTVQALAHIMAEQAAGRLDGPVLIVAPTSVLPNWAAEAARFAPTLRTLVLRGPDRAADFGKIPGCDLVITSYPLLARDRDVLCAETWAIAILDEAQTIRNPATAAATAAFELKAGQRIALSGTPVENHLGDVWSLMRFLNPGLLGDAKTFTREVRNPIEKRGDRAVAARLARRLKPFLLRRTKDEVAADLPPKTEIAETVELTAAQAELYESTRLIMRDRVREALAAKGLARSSVIVLDALLKLRQVCCDPRLVKSASAKAKAGGSAKLARLFELLEQLREEGRRTLIFSQFTSMLSLIREALDAAGADYAWLTGDTLDRTEPVRRFQSGEASLFLISLKAGGVGLNLTAADTVILYDPWWNPAVEAQAIDRAHRIGQTRPVFVHRLIAAGTIEEKMLELQARKRELAAALWDADSAGLGALTEADIEALFG